jgi:cytoskeleton protein RodZ
MKPVGKQLQEARQAKNWTPEMAARETKIKLDRLRDLESDNYTHFTSPAYARGFVRTYARALGLDEYKILRQLDNKLPDDDTTNLVTDSGVSYLPENSMPPRVAHRDYTGLYIVMALGCSVFLIIIFVLFEAYRVGELPGYFAETPPTEVGVKSTDSNDVPLTADTETAPQALPVDPNDTSHAPKAQPVDLNAVTSETNAAPVAQVASTDEATTNAVRALPVDPSALASDTNAPPIAPVASTSDDSTTQAVRALPVDPSELANGTNAAPVAAVTPSADDSTTKAVRALPVDPSELAPPAPVTTSENTKTPPRALPVDPTELAAASTSASQANAGPAASTSSPAADPAPAATSTNGAPAAPDPGKTLVLIASQDSFVRVSSLDAPDTDKPLYAAVLRSGQSIGFAGRKFSIHVGIPAAVDIKLDGVNYGPHSDQEAPETFVVESHLP